MRLSLTQHKTVYSTLKEIREVNEILILTKNRARICDSYLVMVIHV